MIDHRTERYLTLMSKPMFMLTHEELQELRELEISLDIPPSTS